MNSRRGPETVPYQVNLNRIVRERAVTKAGDNSIKLADVVRMAIEKFVDDPIDKTMGQLRRHNRRKREQ